MAFNNVLSTAGLLGLLVLAAPAPVAAQAANASSQLAAASDDAAGDSAMPQHQVEFRPLLDMPRDEGFVTELLLMRAHLGVGMALYGLNVQDQAAAHCSHPLEELYDDLALQLDDRGLPPFGGDLRALTDRLHAHASSADVTAAADKAMADINGAIDTIDLARRRTPGFVVAIAAGLLKAAQEDYESSLTGGKVTSPVEYEDSWAFFGEARDLLGKAGAYLAAKDSAALADLNDQIEDLARLWPSMQPPQQVFADASYIGPILGRIESLRQRFE